MFQCPSVLYRDWKQLVQTNLTPTELLSEQHLLHEQQLTELRGKLNSTTCTVLRNSHLNLPCAPCEQLTACGHMRLSFQLSPQKPPLRHPVTPAGIAPAEPRFRFFPKCKWVPSKCPSRVCSHCQVPPYQLLPQTSAGRRAPSFSSPHQAQGHIRALPLQRCAHSVAHVFRPLTHL